MTDWKTKYEDAKLAKSQTYLLLLLQRLYLSVMFLPCRSDSILVSFLIHLIFLIAELLLLLKQAFLNGVVGDR